MIKRKSKKKFYSAKLIKFQRDAKKTWRIMKELIGKSGIENSSLPQKIVIDKTEIFGETKIANEFNKFFINIGPKLTQKIPQPLKFFESYMNRVNSEMKKKTITVNELKEALYSLKYNKSAGYDDINYNVAKNRFGEFCDPILLIFNLSSSNKQFRFQAGHSTDQVIIPLLDQIYENFEGNKYTPGVFIELSSKAFDFVDHKILLSKLEIYGIKWNMFK